MPTSRAPRADRRHATAHLRLLRGGLGPVRRGRIRWGVLVGAILVAVVGCSQAPAAEPRPTPWADPPDPGAVVAWPAPPAQARIKFLTALVSPEDFQFPKSWAVKAFEWLAGSRQDRFVRPYGIAARDDEALVVTDPGSGSIHVFDLKRQRYRNVTLDDDEGGLRSPVGVALDDQGRLYVADSDRALVFVFTLEGKLVRTIGAGGEFIRPVGLAVQSQKGLLYVVDTLGHRVVVFDRDGRKQFAFGSRGAGPGEFNFPTHVWVTSRAEVLVTDAMNFRIQVFGPDGTFRFVLGQAGDGAGDFSKPKGVAVDSDGHIYVVDAMFDSVKILGRDGTPLLTFGTSGQQPGEFWLPAGLWIDGKDRIYVADAFNQRIQVFQYVR